MHMQVSMVNVYQIVILNHMVELRYRMELHDTSADVTMRYNILTSSRS